MRRAITLSAVLMSVALVSCTIPARIEIYNNAQQEIRLIVGSEEFVLEPGKTTIIGDQFSVREIKVQFELNNYHFQLKEWIPEEFVTWTGWGLWTKRTARFQFESDGLIWLLGKDQDFPTIQFVKQPEGFPLEPTAV